MNRKFGALALGVGFLGAFGATSHAADATPLTPAGGTPTTSTIASPSTTAACSIAAVGDEYSTVQDTTLTVSAGVLSNDTACGEEVHVWETTLEGSLTVAADGTFVYTPAPGFVGDDSFIYFIGDTYTGIGSPAVSGAVIHVTPAAAPTTTPSTAPCSIQLNGEIYWTPQNTALNIPITLGVLANDTACGEDVHIWESTREGSLTLAADGTFVYTPAPGFVGEDSFLYYVGDTYPGPGNALTAAFIRVTGDATPTTTPTTTPVTNPPTLPATR